MRQNDQIIEVLKKHLNTIKQNLITLEVSIEEVKDSLSLLASNKNTLHKIVPVETINEEIYSINDEIDITIRVMPNIGDIEVTLLLKSTGQDIIDILLQKCSTIPKINPKCGTLFIYDLIPINNNIKWDLNESLKKVEIQNGDLILMIPRLV